MQIESLKSIEECIENLRNQSQRMILEKEPTKETINILKRCIYSDVELLRIKIEEFKNNQLPNIILSPSNISDEKFEKLNNELDSLGNQLKLDFVKRKWKFYDIFDEIIRLLGVWMCLVTFASILSLPLIIFKYVDYFLVYHKFISPLWQVTNKIKQFIAKSILCLSGISLTIQGSDKVPFGDTNLLALYSHSSSMDAFIIAAALPIRHYSLAKKDLFLIPYFSWLLVAFGGIPIDRRNRDTAVNSINIAANSVRLGDSIAVAPEGTRSKSGQLLPFKKGPFYLWEKMQVPVVPLVIFGAYDLYPPGKQMAVPGKVILRFLDPILPTEATSREDMSKLVRIRMLDALKDCPVEVSSEISWKDRLFNLGALVTMFLVDIIIYKIACYYAFKILKLSSLQVLSLGTGISIFITLLLYIFVVYSSKLYSQSSNNSNLIENSKLIDGVNKIKNN